MLADLSAYSQYGAFALRAAVGAVFLVHGWAKVKNPAGIASAYGAPKSVGLVHGLLEVAGGLAFITGMYMQKAALVFAVIMLGAIYYKIVKWKMPFTAQQATGWEFDLVLLGAALYYLLQ